MGANPQYLIYLMVFASVILAVQGMMGLGRHAAMRLKLANDRLRRLADDEDGTAVLNTLRSKRGLTQDGNLDGWDIGLRIKTLVLHSGLNLGRFGLYGWIAAMTVSVGGFLYLMKGTALWAGAGAVIGMIAPLIVLKIFVKRRRMKAVTQLPQALDVIVRSLGAGHPVPVAMGLVGREMPDPIGSEFGIASDEVSYGANVSQSVQRISDRIGHEDFDLFAAMIRLQERTGGNLAELLRKNADTIRDRQKMRLKIKAASAEGRMSAMILNVAPIALFFLIKIAAPDFYGEVQDRDVVKYAFWGVAVWMLIGNLVMRKMINFKI